MIKLNEPSIGELEVEACAKVLRSGTLTQGQVTQDFESMFSSFVGSSYPGVAVTSATAGLELSLWALGVGPGDEVIVPDFSWPATGNSVVARGATPVFADICLDTFCISPESLEELITERTKVIMPVHAFGHMADMQRINEIARKYHLYVLEDAACGFGSFFSEQHAGTWGDLGVFSFHPRKIITTGEGGIVVGADAELIDTCRIGRTHGAIRSGPLAEFVDFGFNFRMTEFQAAIGVAQMSRANEILRHRRKAASQLDEALNGIQGIRLPSEKPGFVHSYQSYVVFLEEGIDRDRVILRMREMGVEATLGTYSMASQKSFQSRFGRGMLERLGNSLSAFHRTLSLPVHSEISEIEAQSIARSLVTALQEL